MAREVYVGRIRSLVPACALSLVTFGIYFLVWYYQLNYDVRKHRGKGPDPMLVFALFVLVPVLGWFIATFMTARQVRHIQIHADADHRTSPWYPSLWSLIPIFGWVIAGGILQSGLNRAWDRLHQDLERATTRPVPLECPDCVQRFEVALHPFLPHAVTCPQCGRAGEI